MNCPFCIENIKDRIIAATDIMAVIKDSSPVSRWHVLIIPVRHCTTYFDLTPQEKHDADYLIGQMRQKILNENPEVTGFNIGINCGESAGQTIFHTHIHLIPRRDQDTPVPRGGVRGVIPEKMNY